MSYCNKGRDNSDVTARYIPETREFVCERCHFADPPGDRTFVHPADLREHFDSHLANGQEVPEYALQTIDADIAHWQPTAAEETSNEIG